MMYLLFSGIFSVSALAQFAPLITLEQHSGYTAPHQSFEVICSLKPVLNPVTSHYQLHVFSKISRDRSTGTWNTEVNTDTVLSPAEATQIQTWITEAADGPFQQRPNPCDIGTLLILTPEYPILSSKDCGKRITNQHPSALKLADWMHQSCLIEEMKR